MVQQGGHGFHETTGSELSRRERKWICGDVKGTKPASKL